MKSYHKFLNEVFGQQRDYPDEDARFERGLEQEPDGPEPDESDRDIPEEIQELERVLDKIPELESFWRRGRPGNAVMTVLLDLVSKHWENYNSANKSYTFNHLMKDYPENIWINEDDPNYVDIIIEP
jgi:hypothetical protein